MGGPFRPNIAPVHPPASPETGAQILLICFLIFSLSKINIFSANRITTTPNTLFSASFPKETRRYVPTAVPIIRPERIKRPDFLSMNLLVCTVKIIPEMKSNSTQFYIIQNHKGAHHLDGKYTVFGQVMSGFDVVDLIASQPTTDRDRPLKNIRISVDIDKVSRSDIEKFYNFTYK